MEPTLPKKTVSGPKESVSSVASNEQQWEMVNRDDQMSTSMEARRMKLLEFQAAVALVAIRKNKSKNIAASCYSLPLASSSFPCTLMEMINWSESEQADKEGISLSICWAPDGKYFTINDHEKLSKHVLRRFFKDSKFDSFQRKLYRWGFKQVPPKRDSTRRRQGNVSFYADGFERNNSNSCTTLKVRYSTKEKEQRKNKTLKAKLKKMEKESTLGNNICRRKEKPGDERSPTPRRIGNTPCKCVAVHRGMCTSRANIELGPSDNMFPGNGSPNEYSQFDALAQPDYLLPSSNHKGVPTGDLYCGASSSPVLCQTSILHQHQKILVLKQRYLAKMMVERRTIEENSVVLHGAVCQLRKLQRLAGLSLQMYSSIPRASLGLPYYPIELAQPPIDVVNSLPHVHPDWSACVASTKHQI
jgi:hypothetical protein